jgi:Zn finger protein HypA/HybF involved in hydrogenase expression
MQSEHIKLDRIKLYNETKTIASQLPINIKGFEIAELMVNCGECKVAIPTELIHGYASKPLENTASFQIVFVCPKCKSVAESVQRIKRTGKHTIKFDKLSSEGKWMHSEMNLLEVHWLVKAFRWVLGNK